MSETFKNLSSPENNPEIFGPDEYLEYIRGKTRNTIKNQEITNLIVTLYNKFINNRDKLMPVGFLLGITHAVNNLIELYRWSSFIEEIANDDDQIYLLNLEKMSNQQN